MLKFSKKNVIDLSDWDNLVIATYNKPYSFQQQYGCQERGLVYFSVPDGADDYENDAIPEEVNGEEMGVSFAAWLARDPKEWNGDPADSRFVELFWQRNFYPDFRMIANDLHAKGLIPEGEYAIRIYW